MDSNNNNNNNDNNDYSHGNQSQHQQQPQHQDHHHEALKEFYTSHGISTKTIGIENTIKQQHLQSSSSTTTTTIGTNDQHDDKEHQEQHKHQPQQQQNTLPTEILQHRFVRLHPRYCLNNTYQLLKDEIKEWYTTTNNNDNNNQQQQQQQQYKKQQYNYYPIPVQWMNNNTRKHNNKNYDNNNSSALQFYAIPSNFSLQHHSKNCYNTGRIYGQDVNSGIAVAVLLSNQYDEYDDNDNNSEDANQPQQQQRKTYLRVLDLCCSPGLKLCAIADYLRYNYNYHDNDNRATTERTDVVDVNDDDDDNNNNNNKNLKSKYHEVIGVDISFNRLQICKKIVHKYQIVPYIVDIGIDNNNDNDNDSNNKNDNDNDIDNDQYTINCTTTKKNCDPVRIQLYYNDGTTFGQSLVPSSPKNYLIPVQEVNNTDNDEQQQQQEEEQKQQQAVPLNLIWDSTVSMDNEISNNSNKNHNNNRQQMKRRRMNKSSRAREKKQLQNIVHNSTTAAGVNMTDTRTTNNGNCNKNDGYITIQLFDRVLVDAECSTDGSMKHLSKRVLLQKQQQQQAVEINQEQQCNTKQDCSNNYNNHQHSNNYKTTSVGNNTSTSSSTNNNNNIITIQQLTDSKQLDKLIILQKKLLHSGYTLLKKNGIVVYSTCSLSYHQNEYVVQWLLNSYPYNTRIVPLNSKSFNTTITGSTVSTSNTNNNSNSNNLIQSGTIPGTIRFLPNLAVVTDSATTATESLNTTTNNKEEENETILSGDGFFVAKIQKI